MSGWPMTGWMVQTLVSSALLAAIVLMVRTSVARRFGPRIAYALWLLPALRMVLPPLPGWRQLYFPMFAISRNQAHIGLMSPDELVRMSKTMAIAPAAAGHVEPPSPVIEAIHTLPLGTILLALWLGGAALCFAWQMARYYRFLDAALCGARLLTRECGIDVLISAGVDGPVASGIVKRRIFLPADFMTRYVPDERRLALVHEAAHHDRFDIVANFVALALLSLHWFNPIAQRVYRAFRADQELACDATVLANAKAGDRHAYGSAMLKSASGRMPAIACALSHKAQLKERIGMMARKPVSLGQLLCGAALAMATIGGGLVLTASGDASTLTTEQQAALRDADAAMSDAQAAIARARSATREAAVLAHHAEAEDRRSGDLARRAALRAQAAQADAHRQAMIAERLGSDASVRALDGERQARIAMDAARAKMAARCAAQGDAVSADADWGTLATCGPALQRRIDAALAKAQLKGAKVYWMGDDRVAAITPMNVGADAAEMRDTAREMRDANRAMLDANREAARASREAQREAAQAARETMRD